VEAYIDKDEKKEGKSLKVTISPIDLDRKFVHF
jgi:hypothetical protein